MGAPDFRRAIGVLEALLQTILPETTVLLANYPNPFNPETWIPYQLASASDVQVTIYDTKGILVVRTLDTRTSSGRLLHAVETVQRIGMVATV